jgi:penicillin-binding protein 2
MEEAIGASCNYYMYHIAKIIGHKSIIEIATELGFSQKVGIDLPDEAAGFLPNQKFYSQNAWNLAFSLNLSIGQGPVSVTPLQLNKLISIIATKGSLPKYNIVKQQDSFQGVARIKPQYFDIIQRGMWRSVNDISGTSKAARSRVMIGGKTGTSQVQSKKHSSVDFSSSSTPWYQKNHALFACFAPFDDPKYAISVVVDHGGGGGKTAAPIARQIVELLL